MDNLSYLHGKPQSQANIRTVPEDFRVTELVNFELSGEGEHFCLYIEKKNTNTLFVLKHLAKFFNIAEKLVSYAGLKDRHAVTRQWFSVHLPGRKNIDLSGLENEFIRVVDSGWHNKKIKIGSLKANRFEITLRNITDKEDLLSRWPQIVEKGVPNYFGEQRFGHNQQNLAQAEAMFAGKRIKDRTKKSLYLSAARSHLFNLQLNERINRGWFELIQTGDVMMLAGTQSIFDVENPDEVLNDRLQHFDIDLTASLWGAGELKSGGGVAAMENTAVELFPVFTKGLANFGLKQERRRIRLTISEAGIESDEQSCTISFVLPAGSFATSVLRELADCTDVSFTPHSPEKSQ